MENSEIFKQIPEDVRLRMLAPEGWNLSDDGSNIYNKEIIKTGKYVKGDMEFEVTHETLCHWAETANLMIASGVRIPVPLNPSIDRHAPLNDEKNIRGLVLSMSVVGNGLVAKIQINDSDADNLVANFDTSIESPPAYRDGLGRTYLRPITAVALTERPVVPGLRNWEKIAASGIYTFSLEEEQMNYSKIAASLGLSEDAKEEDIIKACNDLKQFKASIEEEEDKEKKKEITASLPDPKLVVLLSDNIKMKLDNLVEKGLVSPSTRSKLETKFMEDSAMTVLASNGGSSVLSDVLDILKDNTSIRLSEKSGAQVVGLENPLVKESDGYAAMMRAAERK